MNQIDIEPDEDSNDLPPPVAVGEGQESTHPSGHDGQDDRIARNKRKLTSKVHILHFTSVFG